MKREIYLQDAIHPWRRVATSYPALCTGVHPGLGSGPLDP
jgi:hypothetical protein